MPFCTECGARHAEGERVCPRCGEPIFEPPSDEDVDDVLASLDTPGTFDDADEELPDLDDLPPARDEPPAADYLDEMDEARLTIAAQSASVQRLDQLSWANPEAVEIRDQLESAVARLRVLRPPTELTEPHEDFVRGAELLLAGYCQLVDSSDEPDPESARGDAELAIAEATGRFLRGAEAVGDYFMMREADLPGADAELGASPADDEPEQVEDELAGLDDLFDEEEPALDEPPELDEELPPATSDLEPTELLDEVTPASNPQPSTLNPQLADDVDSLDVEPPEALGEIRAEPLIVEAAEVYPPAEDEAEPPLSTLPPVLPPIPMPGSGISPEARAGAWSGVGDPGTDNLLVEIESGWVRARPHVHDAVERAIRDAVVEALRGAMLRRRRLEQETQALVSRSRGEHQRLTDEVESLRGEAQELQAEIAELRRTVNDMERERQIAQERRQQMFHDAETHRSQLLREIEQLGGQLASMRQNITSLLADVGGNPESPARPSSGISPQPPASERPSRPPAPTRSARPAPTPRARGTTGGAQTRTELRIAGVTSLGQTMQIQRALRSLPGVSVEGQPRFREGLMTATVSHDPALDLAHALVDLPGAGLSLQGEPEPNVLELVAA